MELKQLLEAAAAKIEAVFQAERITKQALGELSRDLLEIYRDHGDITLINRLLGVNEDQKFILTPMNWRVAVKYFREFIPHSSNWTDVEAYVNKHEGERVAFKFEGKNANRLKKIGGKLEAWLADENNNIWNFKVAFEPPKKDFLKDVVSRVRAAIAEDKGGFSIADVMGAILEMEEVSQVDLIAALQAANTEEVAPAQAA